MARCANPACRLPTTNRYALTYACAVDCVIAAAKARQAKKERRELVAAKKSIKTRQQWLREAQAAFNTYIRERDRDLPCISCQRYHSGSYDAGHYRTAKASPEIRFDPDNCHRQCVPCNQHLSGNLFLYRQGLLQRIGEVRLGILEGPHPARKYTIPELQEIIKTYRLKLKELKSITIL